MAAVWSSTRLLEFDFSGIEAVLMGWFMRAPGYIRIAKLGVHAYVASHALHRRYPDTWAPADLTRTDAEIGAYLKMIKKSPVEEIALLYDQCKRTVHGCTGPDHEVLTPRGWVRFDQYVDGTPVAQWDNGVVSFVVPTHVTRTPHQGEALICLEGRSLSAQMTEDHRVPYSVHGSPWRDVTAATLPTQGNIPSGGVLEGHETLPPDFLRLIVATQADAAVGSGGLVFHLVKPRKVERLRGLLTALHVRYTDVACACHPTGRRIRVGAPTADLVLAWLDGPEKTFDLGAMLTLTAACREILVEELPYWDGHRVERERYVYFTTNRVQAEHVQTLAATLGRQALLRTLPVSRRWGTKPCYQVSFNTRRHAAVEALTRTRVPYTGLVYCVTVPSTYFLIKHRDRISVTGNTAYGLTTYGMCRNFPKVFPTLAVAEQTQRIYFDLAPEVPTFHTVVRHTAHTQGFLGGAAAYQYLPDQLKVLGHPYGYKHWFWSVVSYERLTTAQVIFRTKRRMPLVEINGITYGVGLGEDAKRAVAMYPQGTARGVLTEAALPLFDPSEPLADHCYIGDLYYGQTPLRAPIHDSLFLEVPTRFVDRAIERTAYAMQRPVEALPCPADWGIGAHLTIGVDAKIGEDWGAMTPVALPSLQDLGVATDSGVSPAEDEDEEAVLDLETRMGAQ